MIAKNYIELPTEGLVRGSILDEGNAVTVYLDVHHEAVPVYREEGQEGGETVADTLLGYPVRVEKPITENRLVNAAIQTAYGLRGSDDVSLFNTDMAAKIAEGSDEDGVKEYLSFIQWIKLEYGKAMGSVSELDAVRQRKLSEIDEYDQSDKVNGFVLNGMTVWLDKATRVGLMNSTTIAKAAGNKTTTLWLGEYKLEVDCDKAIQLLSALEMYALECFNVTAAHKKEVSELENIEDVNAYDITKGYPTMLEMTV